MAFNADGRVLFTEEQLLAIDDHVFYYKCMAEYLNKRKSGGPSSLLPKLKRSIAFLEGEEKEKREPTIDELHKHLESLLIQDRDLADIFERVVVNFEKLLTFEEMIPF